jgi:hypothetical protein
MAIVRCHRYSHQHSRDDQTGKIADAAIAVDGSTGHLGDFTAACHHKKNSRHFLGFDLYRVGCLY